MQNIAHYEQNVEKIGSLPKIYHILHRLKSSRVVLQCAQDNLEIFNSAILAVNEYANEITIDEFKPARGHNLLCDAEKFWIKTKIDGIEITFNTRIKQRIAVDNTYSYIIALPQEINYFQRRMDFRINFNYALAPTVLLMTKEQNRFTGKAQDISAGGLKIFITDQIPQYLPQGETVPLCTVQLSPRIHIISPIEIRFCEINRSAKSLTLGAKFLGLSKSQETAVAKYVVAVERELRRNGVK